MKYNQHRIIRPLLAIIMSFVNYSLLASDTNTPVIKVDGKHQMMNYPADTKPEIYHVHASTNLILDASGYTFDISPEIRDMPINSVQIAQSKTHQFELSWQLGKTRYELSKTTLQPLPGSKAFEGFKAGDKMIVAIGVIYAPRKFAPVWTSIVEVE